MPGDYLENSSLLKHYRRPKNTGRLEKAEFSAEAVNQYCGDEVSVYLRTAHGKISEFRQEARGCMLAVASASLISEWIIGKSLGNIKKLDDQMWLKFVAKDLKGERVKCVTLVLKAIRKALRKK